MADHCMDYEITGYRKIPGFGGTQVNIDVRLSSKAPSQLSLYFPELPMSTPKSQKDALVLQALAEKLRQLADRIDRNLKD